MTVHALDRAATLIILSTGYCNIIKILEVVFKKISIFFFGGGGLI
jgi:hypothetical protein